MAVVSGTRYSFTDASNVAIDMSSTIHMISPSDIPLLSMTPPPAKEIIATKHEWLEDILRPLDTTVADTSLNNTTDPVTFNVAAGSGVYIAVGDILLVGSEQLRVTGVSTDAITVARGFGGSTAAAHASGSAVAIVGEVSLQDAATGSARTTTKSGLFNYTQITNRGVVVTSTDRATEKWAGPNDELSYLLDNEIKVIWQTYERTLLHGRKVASSSGVAGAMDGFLVRISTNAYAKAGATLIEDYILQMMQDSWTAGGRIDTLVMGAFQKRQANKFLDSMRLTTKSDRVAGVIVDTYTSDFGTADIVLDRNMPTDTVLGLERSRTGFGPLRAHALHAVKDQSQSNALKEVWQIVGQYSSELRNESAHGKITGLATS